MKDDSAAMSVLYDALRKAARENDDDAAPAVLPIAPRRRERLNAPLLLCGAGLCLLISLVSVGYAVYVTTRDVSSGYSVEPVAAQEPGAKTKDGIALAVPALDLREEVASALQEQDASSNAATVPALNEETIQARSSHLIVAAEEGEDGDDPIAALARAEDFVRAQEWGRARAYYDDVLERQPRNRRAFEGKIYALEQGDSPDALAEIQSMMEAYPTHARLYAAQARLLAHDGDFPAALAAWQKATELDRRNKSYRLGLAVTHDRLGHGDEALTWYRKAGRSDLPPDVRKRMDYLARRAALLSEEMEPDDVMED